MKAAPAVKSRTSRSAGRRRRTNPAVKVGKSARRNHPPLEALPIVGIGASAGGLEAATRLLRDLPPDTGMAFVLVQHLDPTHDSALALLLSRATTMKVAEAKNNQRLAPNRLYILPPNKVMGLSGTRLKLFPRDDGKDERAPVDFFLRSLAESAGRRAIAVILSGNGSDGTQGFLAIKAAGGITFAQSKRSAKYAGMPGSAIAAGGVDYVLTPEEIARELTRFAGRSHALALESNDGEVPRPAEQRAFDDILAHRKLADLRQ
jgi:two-component system CheB/CheR fusion protein